MKETIDGVVPVIPIPFGADEDIDPAALRCLVDTAVNWHATAVCLPAYGSEFYKLSDIEREQVVGLTIEQVRKRVPVIAHANHSSSKIAAETARRFASLGADVIGIALPRQFPVTDNDLLRYCGRIADAVSVPLLVQDFNPGGPTVSVDFLCRLHRAHGNVKYVKLEEPLVGVKLEAVRDRVGESLRTLTGWGGMYLLDGIAAGSCGVMPGLAICDLFARVWAAARAGRDASASFARLLPYISFSLQTFELFLAMEKRILVRRGVLENDLRRDLTRTIEPAALRRSERIIDELLQIVTDKGAG